MKNSLVFMLTLLFCVSAFAQDRYVVRGKDAIPIPKGKSAHEVALEKGWTSTATHCPAGAVTPWRGTGVNFGHFSGDVALMRILAPVTGVIESVYFETLLYGADDSSAAIRIFESAFTPDNPEPLGTGWLGYYEWPLDPHDAAIPNDPYMDTPGITGWVVGDSALSPWGFDPNGVEIWGLGGYPVTWHPNTVNGIATIDLGYEPMVDAGDYFNVNIRVTNITPEDPDRNELVGAADGADPADFLKYYYRGRLSDFDVGWWARVDFNVNIWTVIRAAGNIPPIISSLTDLNHTTSNAAQTVCVRAFDCNPGAPADTGIASAVLYYAVDGGAYTSVPMTGAPPEWCADIPGMSGPASIEYYVELTDNLGAITESLHDTYRVVDYTQNGYTTTFPAYTFIDVSGTGTEIPGTSFFAADGMTQNEDDGTAGPVDLGQTFNLFGQSLQYAWVGANGAIALTTTPDDTTHLNAGGFYTLWQIPENDASFPQNMIMAFWNDLYLAPGGLGSVWYQDLGTMFVIQWEGVGNFNDPGDMTTFQIILDMTDPTDHVVYFSYEDVGTTGLDLTASTGLQVNTADQWLLICDNGYPVEGVPADMKTIMMVNDDQVSVEPPGGEIPSVFALYPNYPNPFNPTTKITYSIPTASDVRLSVYNLLGEEVAALVSERQDAGTYSVDFSGGDLASGMYFYTLKAGHFVDTKKMMLIK